VSNILRFIAIAFGCLVLAACSPFAILESDHNFDLAPRKHATARSTVPYLREVSGTLHFARIPCWDDVVLDLTVDIVELNPADHTATGTISWSTTRPDVALPADDLSGTAGQQVAAKVTHIFFGADEPNGDPNGMVIVAQIESADGNSLAQRGEYAYIWLHDGQNDADEWGIYPYAVEPRLQFFPHDLSPALLGYFDVGAMQITDPWFPGRAESGAILVEEVPGR
jgi:hypothetical protein